MASAHVRRIMQTSIHCPLPHLSCLVAHAPRRSSPCRHSPSTAARVSRTALPSRSSPGLTARRAPATACHRLRGRCTGDGVLRLCACKLCLLSSCWRHAQQLTGALRVRACAGQSALHGGCGSCGNSRGVREGRCAPPHPQRAVPGPRSSAGGPQRAFSSIGLPTPGPALRRWPLPNQQRVSAAAWDPGRTQSQNLHFSGYSCGLYALKWSPLPRNDAAGSQPSARRLREWIIYNGAR